MSDRKRKFRVERTGFGDTRLILDDLGGVVGLAVQMANGAWGAFDEDANRRLTMQLFKTPAQVRKWFEENSHD